MPTRKVSERERLTIYARTASDDELDTALEILRIEQRARAAVKTKKPAANKPTTASKPKPNGGPAPTGVITGDQQ